jgi:hypothetical protein
MRFAALTAVAFVLAVPAAGFAQGWYWPVAKVMRAIDGARVRVGGRVIRVDSETTLCSGMGRRIRRHGVRMWSRFECTYTTFTSNGADRDLEFEVRVSGRTRYAIRDAHWVGVVR